MKYTEKQIEQYFSDYIDSNKDAIKSRLRFLLDIWKQQDDQLIATDVWYCFEEARHAFMMGDFVASIIMSSVTMERYLASLLGLPYFKPVDEKTSLEGVGKRVIKSARKKNIIDDDLKKKLLKLNKMRTDFVHGIDSNVHQRPQKKNSIVNTFMWTEPTIHYKEIERKAKESIKILFEAMKKLHYTKLNYY